MKGFLLAVAAICLTGSTLAADLPSTAPPSAPVSPAPAAYDWTGFYFGGHFGRTWGRSDTTEANATTGAFLGSGSGNGATTHGGGQIGYNFMTASRMVIGVRAGLTFNPDTSSASSNAAGTYVVAYSSSGNLAGNINARLGYALGDFLPYAMGGWVWGTGTSTRTQELGTQVLATPGVSERENRYANGWDLGAGLEYRVRTNWTVFTEYYYEKYAKSSLTYSLADLNNRTSQSANAVVLGVNYKF